MLRCIYTIALYIYYPITLYHFYLIVSREDWSCPGALFADYFCIGDYTPRNVPVASWQYPSGCDLSNSNLSSHAVNQLLGIVAEPSLEHRLDVLGLFNSF